jgi:hypothetical protein
MKVIALDPGRTTGYSVGIMRPETEFEFISKQAKLSHEQLYDLLFETKPDCVVCESFDFRNGVRTGTDLISAELIGVVHLFAVQAKKRLDLQSASTHGAGGKHGRFNNVNLKRMGIYVPARPHAMDSLRILLYWYEHGKGFQFNNRLGFKESMFHHL